MSFVESLCTLSMDRHEREHYYNTSKNCELTGPNLYAAYMSAKKRTEIALRKEQISDIKAIQNHQKPAYDSLDPLMKSRIQDALRGLEDTTFVEDMNTEYAEPEFE